jgi:hypothetical protein
MILLNLLTSWHCTWVDICLKLGAAVYESEVSFFWNFPELIKPRKIVQHFGEKQGVLSHGARFKNTFTFILIVSNIHKFSFFSLFLAL